MKHRKFISTGWRVSQLGLGTYPFSTNWGRMVGAGEAVRIVERALELGVNFIDTANVYGYGRAETIVGEVLSDRAKREKVYLATKGGRDFTSRPGEVFKNFEVDYLRRALALSLERLRTRSVDLYWLHGPDREVVEAGEVFKFLNQIKAEGLAKAVGVSLNSPNEALFILNRHLVDAVGFPFNILSPYGIGDILRLCQDKGVAVVLREPLAQGLLTGKHRASSTFSPDDFRSNKFDRSLIQKAGAVVNELRLTTNDKVSPAQTALRYVLSCETAAVIIFGAKSVNQLEENIRSVETDLTDGDKRRIDAIREEFFSPNG